MKTNRRLNREKRTVQKMILLYCQKHDQNNSPDLCPDCQNLSGYALQRIQNCPFGENKPTCAKCRIHCYRPDMKQQIKEVMRFSGPRMIFNYPYLAFMHLKDTIVSSISSQETKRK